jgi:hypothetical protein
MKKKQKTPRMKILFWVTTDDGDEDWFIIARSAKEAERLHEDLEGYDRGDACAEPVADIPEKWQSHPCGWPDLKSSLLSDCGGVRLVHRPEPVKDGETVREQMGVVSEAWVFNGRAFRPGDIVANVARDLRR